MGPTLFSIYALVDPVTGALRYVGKSVISLKARLSNHEYKARSGRTTTPTGDWIRGLQSVGLHPQIRLLEETTGRWQDVERTWIRRLRAEGHDLLNLYDGGNGAHTRASLAPEFAALLGKLSDGRIAEMSGLCRETITYHRRRAGIPVAPFDESRRRGTFKKGQVAHNKSALTEEAIASMTGFVDERTIAARFHISRGTLRKKRKERGLPYFKRTYKSGVAHHFARLTPEIAREIRALYKRYSKEHNTVTLAKKYGMSRGAIHDVLSGKTWKEDTC